MANWRVSNGAGSAFATAANWDQVTNTPTINASTNLSISTGGTFTATFTAPNLVNKSTGCAFYILNVPAGNNIVATLYESGVAVASTATTVADSAIPNPASTAIQGYWLYFRWATPYTFTTTTAGAYKVQIKVDAGTALTVAADSGAANPAFLHTDNRNVAPGLLDNLWVVGNNGVNTTTINLTGTSASIGAGQDTTSPGVGSARSIGCALNISNGGTFTYDTLANSTITCLGHVNTSNGGTFQKGTTGTPIPNGVVATTTINQNGVSGNYGITVMQGAQFYAQGTPTFTSPTTNWKTYYVSGTGATGNELVVSTPVNWAVGDEIVITATSNNVTNYNESEVMFIQSVVSPTKYGLSTTSGGANAALTYTHNTNAHVLNVQRNCVFNTNSTSQASYLMTSTTVQANFQVKWARFVAFGVNSAKNGIMMTINTTSLATGLIDYTVIKGTLFRSFGWNTVSSTETHTGLVSYAGANSASENGMFLLNGSNKTLIDCFAIGSQSSGFELNALANATFTRCVVNACNIASPTNSAGMFFFNTLGVTFANCEINCTNSTGMLLDNVANVTFSSLQCGTLGQNQTSDILPFAGAYAAIVFNTCSFGSTNLFNVSQSYTGASSTSTFTFGNLNGTNYNNYTYSPLGIFQTTGAGLTDTNVRTAATYNYRLAPTDATTGITFSYYKVVNVGEASWALGFIQQNAAFTGDVGASCVINLYLPGNQLVGATPDATYTMPKTDNNFDPYILSANYLGTIPGLTRIDVVVKTATANAYAYVADLDNGSNALTNFKIWNNGIPSQTMPETLGDAIAMLSIPTSALTASGSIGNLLSDALTVSDFIGLK